jgi:type II restriction enzyme
LDHLDYGGVIPELFAHDSTEEKVFAKYCDALLARALNELGLTAHVIDARGDAADVRAVHPNLYTLVGDAKAFRLSRTAKNQKDFKVEALNQWRHGADFACLLAPIYQYPNKASQIYSQAIRYNVTLLSYTHLAFLIRNKNFTADDLGQLWQLGQTLTANSSAVSYWSAIRAVVLELTGLTNMEWEQAVADTRTRLREQAGEQIRLWENEKTRIATLDQQTAIRELVEALKIDSKIAVIRRTGKLQG